MFSSSLRQEEEQELILSLIGRVHPCGKSVERNVNEMKETRDGSSTGHSRNESG